MQPNATPYLVLIGVLSVVAALAIVLVSVLRPEHDNAAVIAAIVGGIAPVVTVLVGMLASAQRGAATQEMVASLKKEEP